MGLLRQAKFHILIDLNERIFLPQETNYTTGNCQTHSLRLSSALHHIHEKMVVAFS